MHVSKNSWKGLIVAAAALHVLPAILCLALMLLLLAGCAQQAADVETASTQGESLSYETSEVPESLEDTMEQAAFYVKATAQTAEDIGSGVIEYGFALEEDFAGNLLTAEDGSFSVSGETGDFTIGETYYLALTANSTPKYRSIGVILYTQVDSSRVILAQGEQVSICTVSELDSETETEATETAANFEAALSAYIAEHENEITQRAAEAIPDTSAGSLEAAVAGSDAIWMITIQDGSAVNTYFSVCKYQLDQVLKGENSYAGQKFNETIPNQSYEVGGQYLLFLSEVQRESDSELSVVYDDYWLIPADSEDAQTALALCAE